MHSVELLEEALALAGRLGIRLRQEWLGGGGGVCDLKGERWIFVDLALTPWEQLTTVAGALRSAAGIESAAMSGALRRVVFSGNEITSPAAGRP